MRRAIFVAFLAACLANISWIDATFANEPQHAPGLHERPYLFGDWRGARTRLMQRGIILDFHATQFYQGITSGGNPGARNEWEYGGVGDAVLTLVGDKFGWKGFAAIIHAETRYGNDINSELGLAPPNFRLLFPPVDPPVVAVTGWQLVQQIRDGWAISAGKFHVGDFWEQVYHRGNGTDKFMNASIVLPLNLGRPVTGHSIPGAAILKTKGREVEGALAVFDTKDYSTKFGVDDLFDRGATILGLWKFFYNIHGLPGYSSVVGVYNTREFRSIDPASLIIIPGQGVSLGDVDGSWALTYIINQKLWMDSADKTRNIEMNAQVGIGDENPNPVRWIAGVTVEAHGLIPHRKNDSIGVGYFYTGLNDRFKRLVGGALSLQATRANFASTGVFTPQIVSLQDTQGLEVYYKFAFTPWFSMTADLQVIQPSTDGFDTAIVAGVRSKLKF